KVVLPADLTVGGRLDLNADLEADLEGGAAPSARATVELADGRFGKYRDLSLKLEGQYRAKRVAGQMRARAFGTGVNARFDLPTEWPLADARGPLLLDLTTA